LWSTPSKLIFSYRLETIWGEQVKCARRAVPMPGGARAQTPTGQEICALSNASLQTLRQLAAAIADAANQETDD